MIQNLTLGGRWEFKACTDSQWLAATVPGSVLADLLDLKKIEDPFWRENEYETRDLFNEDYEYRRTFTVDKSLLAHQKVELSCKGLDTLTEITINGRPVAKTDNMHVEYAFEVKNLLKEGENEIHIRFLSTNKYISEHFDAGDIHYIATGNMRGTAYLRKAHCMCGWDWGPQLPDAGIWRDISLQGISDARLTDVHITQTHADGKVVLHVTSEAELLSGGTAQLQVTVKNPDGSILSISQAFASEEKASLDINISSPQLWWPNGYGAQPLYTIVSELLYNGASADCCEKRIGLRTMEISRDKDQWGEEFCYKVNGIKIFAMGADYIPEDNILRRVTSERTRRLLTDCVRANFNSIRVWGGGYYPDDFFFDICDELGLVVWLDLMFACNVYKLDEAFEKNIVLEAEQNVARVRHHASLGLISGNNEMEFGWLAWADVVGHSPALRADYIKMFEYVLQKVCEKTAPEVFYWPSSPSSGGCFDRPNDENMGDVHYWDVWHGMKPFTDYRNFYFRFCSEFGFQSFPAVKTIESYTLPEDRNVFSPVMESHQKNGSANGKILAYLSENYRYPSDFGKLIYTSQLLQADAIRYGVEHWRRNRGRCMGAIYWQLNDCWPVASWASVDYFGRWKALHYSAKKFFAPILLSACENGPAVELHVSNESMNAFAGTIKWFLRDNTAKVIASGEASAETAALSSGCICNLEFSKELAAAKHNDRRLVLDYRLYQGETCVSDGSVLFVQEKHYEFLNPGIKTAVRDCGDSFAVTLTASTYARGAAIETDGFDCIFSDNWFALYAGEEKTVTVLKSDLSKPVTAEELAKAISVTSTYDIAQ